MKIRINGNSIRYRLTRTDIVNLGKDGFVEEKTEFPDRQPLFYCLQKKEGITNLAASFSSNRICILIPENMATEWATTDVVGFDHKMNIDEGKELYLLVEKDFTCLDLSMEDQSDNYPNPKVVS